MRYDLVIFDNDGVLVDSEPIANRILAEYLTELGHPTSYQDSLRDYLGSAVHHVHDLIMERSGRTLPLEFDDTLHARTVEAFHRELRPVPGMADVLAKLDVAAVPYCVASSASHARIRAALRMTKLYDHFSGEMTAASAYAGAVTRIFSAQDVGRGKPAPDLFLFAADTLGIAPGRCAVVEDSALGVQAAVAAGMDVYGLAGLTPIERLSGAKAVFRDPIELLPLLGM